MKLSILICTVPSRVGNFLPAAVTELQRQIDSSGQGQVELIYLGDNKQRTVGRKRNDLLQLAQGEYVAFVDDDDRVAPNYISRIHFNQNTPICRTIMRRVFRQIILTAEV